MNENPIACTLSADDQATRGDEWRRFLDTNVIEAIRTESSARLRLMDGDAVIIAAVDLARREQECCAFFEFRLELLPNEVWLEIGAPAEASPLLDALAGTGSA